MSLNDEIAEFIDRKYTDKQALRRARKEEMAALIRKANSAIRLEYQMALARARKV